MNGAARRPVRARQLSTYGRRGVQLVAVVLLALSTTVSAEPRPRFETGVGGLVAAVPAYRGSEHYGAVALPFPYVVYRGEKLRLTRQGARVLGLGWEDFSLGLSGALSWPGDGGEDPARDGMPALDPTLEMGPSLNWSRHSEKLAFCLCVPIRYVTATDGEHWRSAGWLAHPQVRLQRLDGGGDSAFTTSIHFGPKFASRLYHEYYYEVRPKYATAARPAFDAAGGYSGFATTLSFGMRRGRWGAGVAVNGDWLRGVAFEDSPLVKSDTSVTAGVWVIYRLWSTGSAGSEGDLQD